MARKIRELGFPIHKDKSLIESRKNLKKLYVFFTVVNYHSSDEVIKILEGIGCSASYVCAGSGTSVRKVYDVLGVYGDKKGVIMTVVRDDLRQDVIDALNEYFEANKANNPGVSFSVPVSSLIGAKLYYFFTNSF